MTENYKKKEEETCALDCDNPSDYIMRTHYTENNNKLFKEENEREERKK